MELINLHVDSEIGLTPAKSEIPTQKVQNKQTEKQQKSKFVQIFLTLGKPIQPPIFLLLCTIKLFSLGFLTTHNLPTSLVVSQPEFHSSTTLPVALNFRITRLCTSDISLLLSPLFYSRYWTILLRLLSVSLLNPFSIFVIPQLPPFYR